MKGKIDIRMAYSPIPGSRDKPLFTPGPLTTSASVKQAMLRDLGSRDFAFINIVKDIRRRLLDLACAASPAYESIILQGSGTFGIEACIASFTPPQGVWLCAINGSYGKRFAAIANALGIQTVDVVFNEDEPVDPDRVKEALKRNPGVTGLATVHCETTSGIMNPVQALGEVAKEKGVRYFVDAMSSFGAVPLDAPAAHIDYLVSSANKCIEGVPGFSFAIVKREALEESEGWARSVVLDLFAQWKGLDASGQFRFTPPTHTLLAFHQALLELEREGGVEGRAARYRANHQTLVAGMRAMGFKEFLAPENQGYIITSFYYPDHPSFDFETFYKLLNDNNCVIYPGKVGAADCFRIGSIGRLFPPDFEALLGAVRRALDAMGVTVKEVA
jgi:2-aminoethylphosphonate-pyruvate transaminase